MNAEEIEESLKLSSLMYRVLLDEKLKGDVVFNVDLNDGMKNLLFGSTSTTEAGSASGSALNSVPSPKKTAPKPSKLMPWPGEETKPACEGCNRNWINITSHEEKLCNGICCICDEKQENLKEHKATFADVLVCCSCDEERMPDKQTFDDHLSIHEKQKKTPLEMEHDAESFGHQSTKNYGSKKICPRCFRLYSKYPLHTNKCGEKQCCICKRNFENINQRNDHARGFAAYYWCCSCDTQVENKGKFDKHIDTCFNRQEERKKRKMNALKPTFWFNHASNSVKGMYKILTTFHKNRKSIQMQRKEKKISDQFEQFQWKR